MTTESAESMRSGDVELVIPDAQPRPDDTAEGDDDDPGDRL